MPVRAEQTATGACCLRCEHCWLLQGNLLDAARDGDRDKVQRWLNAGVSVNCIDRVSISPCSPLTLTPWPSLCALYLGGGVVVGVVALEQCMLECMLWRWQLPNRVLSVVNPLEG
jgi:hypothetical protein